MTTACPPPRHERTPEVALRIAAGVALAGALVMSIASPAGARGILPGANPPRNVSPEPDYRNSGACAESPSGWSCANPCVLHSLTFPAYSSAPACTSYVLRAINHARRLERLGHLRLPTNWSTLSVPEQLFVLADLERTSRGLPPYLGLNDALTREAQSAANASSDPTLAPGFAVGIDPQGYDGMGGAWSGGFSPLGADYAWMYNDGWGGSAATTSNVACTWAGAAGCWAHRDELLGFDPRFNPGVGLGCTTCEMGAGFAITPGSSSFVDLVELPAGAPPPMTFTWAKDVKPYLRAHVHHHHRSHSYRHRSSHHVNARTAAHRAARRDAWSTWDSSRGAPRCTAPLPSRSFGPLGCRHQTFTPTGKSPGQ